MNLDELWEEIVMGRGWGWQSNGLEGGQLQINIIVDGNTFCWWPLSQKKTFFHKKLKEAPGKKTLKYLDVTPDTLIRHIEARLKEIQS